MSEHPIDVSTRFIDSGTADGPHNRITHELSDLADGVSMVESFSHVVLIETLEGIVAFDTGSRQHRRDVMASIRGWRTDPIHTVVYTHGHLDHVGGSPAFAADAAERGHPATRVMAHENVSRRFDRYRLTNGWNWAINLRQFGGAPPAPGEAPGGGRDFVPDDTLEPTTTYRDTLVDVVGGVEFHHHHALGETDDHTWTWIPEHRTICAGDQFIWNFPNCGNPQKVQRYPAEWAASLRDMAATDVELFVPAHGLPIAGNERIRGVLHIVADTLETLVADVIAAMNTGARLDEVLHSVRVAPEVLELPYLRPLYDEPEFVVRNIWRQYGGWWDGNPARLKPAPDAVVAAELASLAGGADVLAGRAVELARAGDLRLACHLAELAAQAEPDSRAVHEQRSEVYRLRRDVQTSLMSKGIFGAAVGESEQVVTGETPRARMRLSIGEDG